MAEQIKKVLSKIYSFDFSKCPVIDGNEFITENGVSEFVTTFKKQDLANGIVVMPTSYQKGLVYCSSHNGEILNPPSWIPDITSFGLNVVGLKKGSIYRVIVIGRTSGSNNLVTPDRNLVVTTSERECLINADLTEARENTEFTAYFRANSNELTFGFTLGKIYINNVIIDEVELAEDAEVQESDEPDILESGKMQTIAYGVFSVQAIMGENFVGKYIPLTRYAGKGLNLYFDKSTASYILERDNVEDTIADSFTKHSYIVDINTNKLVSKGHFEKLVITEVRNEPSPSTLKQGYLRFELQNTAGKPIAYNSTLEGSLFVIVSKIY